MGRRVNKGYSGPINRELRQYAGIRDVPEAGIVPEEMSWSRNDLGGIAAGARSVMVTYWDVIQEPSTILLNRFMGKLNDAKRKGELKTVRDWIWKPAIALTQAQREMASGNGDFSDEQQKKMNWPDESPWSDLAYWAPFALVN